MSFANDTPGRTNRVRNIRRHTPNIQATQPSRQLFQPRRSSEEPDDDERMVSSLTQALVNANAILEKRAQEKASEKERERRAAIGVYAERRSKLSLALAWSRLTIGVLLAVGIGMGYPFALQQLLVDMPDEVARISEIARWVVGCVIVCGLVLAVRSYLTWSRDVLYADAERVGRRRLPVWWLGITKVDFEVKQSTASCDVTQSLFESAIRSIGVSSSTVTIETPLQRDEVLHDMKYVKDANRLSAIIQA